jgi:hypothetical protein
VTQSGGAAFPRIEVTVTRFREWGRDGACRVHVTQRKHFVSYSATPIPAGDRPGAWSLNEPFQRRTLDGAVSSRGRAAMDRVRNRWKALPGVTPAEAKAEIDRIIRSAISKEGR